MSLLNAKFLIFENRSITITGKLRCSALIQQRLQCLFFSEKDIEKIVQEKERFKNKPVNFAMKKVQLMKEKEYAELSGDHQKALEYSKQIDELEGEAKRLDRERTKNIAAISFINERNRMKNIKEAEKAIEEDIKLTHGLKDDPFTRRKCAPTMVHVFTKNKPEESGGASGPSLANGQPAPSDSNLSTSSSSSTISSNSVRKSATKPQIQGKKQSSDAIADDLFDAHNFDIKIDFDTTTPLEIL